MARPKTIPKGETELNLVLAPQETVCAVNAWTPSPTSLSIIWHHAPREARIMSVMANGSGLEIVKDYVMMHDERVQVGPGAAPCHKGTINS